MVTSLASPEFYNYLAPVRDATAFFGRAGQLQCVCECIGRKEHISFVGEPGSGLTSLLIRLLAPDFGAKCEVVSGPLQFVFLDCTLFDSPLPLLRYLLLQVAPDRPLPQVSDWRALHSRFMATLRSMGPKRLILLFDDFEALGCNHLFVQWIESLRGLAVEREMSLITTTHRDLHECCHRDIVSSPFPNIFKAQTVMPFSPEESREFLDGTCSASGIDLEPYYERIVSLGGTFPCYLTMACSLYYRAIVKGGEPDPRTLAEQFVIEAQPGFERIWNGLDANERRVLSDLAYGKTAYLDAGCRLEAKGYLDKGGIFCTAFRDYVKGMIDQHA